MNRSIWPVQENGKLEKELKKADDITRAERTERIQFIQKEFGSPTDMLLVGGTPAMFALREMQNSFVVGNFMATILLSQVFIEHSLGGSFMMMGDDDTATGGLAKLIDKSLLDCTITSELAEKLHKLRKMRNPYTHPNPGVTDRSYMGRMAKKKIFNSEQLAEEDARIALQTVVDFIRHQSPHWHPNNTEKNKTTEGEGK